MLLANYIKIMNQKVYKIGSGGNCMDNIKKVTIGVIVVMLVGVFLVSFGDGITGYSILSKDIKLDSYPLPFVRNGAYDNLFIVVPDDANSNVLLAAEKIADGLQGGRIGRPMIIQENRLLPGSYNLIFVGNPCNLKTLNALLNSNECDYGLDNEGMIRLVDVARNRYLVVTGSDAGIMKAALVLKNYQNYGLMGKEIIVQGNLNDPLGLVLRIK